MNPLEDPAIDEFPMSDNPEVIEKMKKEQAKLKDLQKLFEGLKFFIGREVPRDQIVFVIRYPLQKETQRWGGGGL